MTTTGPAMRYERVAMLNVGTALAPSYKLMGTGFETLDDALNPEVDEVTYISDVTATKTVTGYAPEWSFDATVIKDDDVVKFLRNIGKTLATGEAAETDIVLYDAWDVSAIDGTVAAVKQTVAVSMDSIGSGSGGEKLAMSGTLLAVGDQIDGTFDTDDNSFTPSVS